MASYIEAAKQVGREENAIGNISLAIKKSIEANQRS